MCSVSCAAVSHMNHDPVKQHIVYDYDKEFDNIESSYPMEKNHISDPLMVWNRKVFHFNQAIAYPLILDPIANFYLRITNSTIRLAVNDFLDTWYNGISNIALSTISYDLEGLLISIWRFSLNTTIGMGGIYNATGDFDIPIVNKSIGQVLSYYGMGTGSYIVLPFLGPSGTRDVLGLGIRFVLVYTLLHTPDMFPKYTYIGSLRDKAHVISNVNLVLVGATSLNTYVKIKPILDDLNVTSLDPYIAYREAFLQNRDFVINKENADIRNGRFDHHSDEKVPVFRDRMIDIDQDINDHVIGSRYISLME